MPLAYQGILKTLDPELQVTVASVYLKLMQRAGEQNLSAEELDKTRDLIARRLLFLARDGEQDASVLEAKAEASLF